MDEEAPLEVRAYSTSSVIFVPLTPTGLRAESKDRSLAPTGLDQA